ncbi:(Fe-S)-binding protein [Tepidibacillus infernus]|uniref:(Fe-S)-binding protein n=1 Tax=Tepidibacillus infernus TaxID=1806172 RepID=UPI003B6DB180
MKISLFATCITDMFYPDAGKAAVNLLRRFGVEVDFPQGQTCCGQPSYNSGYMEETRQAAKQMIRAFENSEYIIGLSGSCSSMLKVYYPELFENDPEWYPKAVALSKKVYEFSQFFVDVLGITDVGAELNTAVTLHIACHTRRGMGVVDQPEAMLKAVKGLKFVPIPNAEDCCGFGGTFSVKNHLISEEMVQEKSEHVLETGAKILVGTDMACLMNIGGRLRHNGKPLPMMHIAELLERGLANK